MLFDDVKARAASGTCPPCLGAKALEDQDKFELSDLDIAYTLSSPFLAGIETVSASSFYNRKRLTLFDARLRRHT
jgi:hypothetical protein